MPLSGQLQNTIVMLPRPNALQSEKLQCGELLPVQDLTQGNHLTLTLDPSEEFPSLLRVLRTSGFRRTESEFNQSCYAPFRSPRPSPKSEEADEVSEESLKADIQKLKEKQDMLDKEISQLVPEGYHVIGLEDHIALLHEYNDVKDVAQMTLGKLAVTRGVTTKELYPDFDLDLSD
ncbi:DNA repair protein SWI5 homolog [Acomys russatus]|uniref:DNA repair protein SWI5 homolog n=1 Tax=Acomys russatus TaxID=60746 RepID=UPI0021E2C303|nr:DNA repair protein SWI5 homolog [Acomys russatus]